jgi:hydroxylamine dehydrogenase
LKTLRSDNLLLPAAGNRPSYPNSYLDSLFPRERIGFFDGQASAFYNVSNIERDYFEMWYFDNLSAYKGAAHGDYKRVNKSHLAMDQDLIQLKEQATKIRLLREQEKQAKIIPETDAFFNSGDYTDFNRENN